MNEEVNGNAEMLFNGQVELVQWALGYVGGNADDIYVYASAENNWYSYYAFFGLGGQILTPGQIEGKSDEDVRALQRHGTKLLSLFIKRCKSSGDPVPTEFKIHYQVDRGELSSSIKYDPVLSASDGLTAGDIYLEWKEELIATYRHRNQQ